MPSRAEAETGMSDAPPKIPEEIVRFYRETPEEDRLAARRGQLEFSRTKEIVLPFLPRVPATVLDVGGAAGIYALWLAGLGYRVHLLDASPRLVEEARRHGFSLPRDALTCQIGDARALPFADGSADAVLLLGPLYHLTEAADRRRALEEAHRALRPGGVLFAAAISRAASSLDGISRDLFADPAFAEIVRSDLERGQHRNTTGNPNYFTTAYFHRPDELQAEVASAGFTCEAMVGIEGPGWLFADFDERWADDRKREDLLRVARDLGREPSTIGVSAHMLAVGKRPS